jgi:hypothetical protein
MLVIILGIIKNINVPYSSTIREESNQTLVSYSNHESYFEWNIPEAKLIYNTTYIYSYFKYIIKLLG